MGDAIFVSHQWVGNMHPDPESKQLRVLQDALTRMLEKLEPSVRIHEMSAVLLLQGLRELGECALRCFHGAHHFSYPS